MKRLIVILAVILFAGCTMQKLRKEPEMKKDDFSNSQLLGVQKKIGSEDMFGYDKYFLRSFETDSSWLHQLCVDIDYYGDDWRFYYSAKDENKHSLKFVEIDRRVIDCDTYDCKYEELFSALIPEEKLKNNIDGYRVKFYAKDGSEVVVELTENQIRKQLNTIQKIAKR